MMNNTAEEDLDCFGDLMGGFRRRNLGRVLVANALQIANEDRRCRALSRRKNSENKRYQRCGVKVREGSMYCYQHRKHVPFYIYDLDRVVVDGRQTLVPARRISPELQQGIEEYSFNTTLAQVYVLKHIKNSCRRHQIPLNTSIKQIRLEPYSPQKNPFVCLIKTNFEGEIVPFVATNKFVNDHEYNGLGADKSVLRVYLYLPFGCAESSTEWPEVETKVKKFLDDICVQKDLGQIFNCQVGTLRDTRFDGKITKLLCHVVLMNFFGKIPKEYHAIYMLSVVKYLAKLRIHPHLILNVAEIARLYYVNVEKIKTELLTNDYLSVDIMIDRRPPRIPLPPVTPGDDIPPVVGAPNPIFFSYYYDYVNRLQHLTSYAANMLNAHASIMAFNEMRLNFTRYNININNEFNQVEEEFLYLLPNQIPFDNQQEPLAIPLTVNREPLDAQQAATMVNLADFTAEEIELTPRQRDDLERHLLGQLGEDALVALFMPQPELSQQILTDFAINNAMASASTDESGLDNSGLIPTTSGLNSQRQQDQEDSNNEDPNDEDPNDEDFDDQADFFYDINESDIAFDSMFFPSSDTDDQDQGRGGAANEHLLCELTKSYFDN